MGKGEAMSGGVDWDWPLVGRDGEVATITALLGAFAGGGADRSTPSGALLYGPGGVGKTRVAAECLAVADHRGFTTSRAAATRASARITLGAMAPLLPELGDHTVNLLVAARENLAELAGDRPLLLFVDDAHVLDDASALLLLQLAAERQVFLLATVRSGEDVSDAITALWKDRHVERLDVAPLSDTDLDGLIDASLTGLVDPAARAELRRVSAGNPLALRELMMGAVETRTLAEVGGTWRLHGRLPVSPRLADLAEERLGSLTAAESDVIEYVALGEPVDVAVLESLAAADAIEAVERRGLIVVRRDEGRLEAWLAHPLHGEVLRANTGTLRTRNVLRSLADALERHPTGRRGDTLRLATWRLDSGGPADPELLVAAARQAFVALDIELARRFSEAAWEIAPSFDAGHLLGHVLCDLGSFIEAERVLAATEPLATTDHQRVLVTMSRTENLFRMNRIDDAIRVNLEAEAAVGDGEDGEELAGHRATFVLLSGRPADAFAIVSPMLDAAAVRPMVQAAIAGGTVLTYDGRPEAGYQVHERAWADAQTVWGSELLQSDPGIHVVGMIGALIEGGRLAEAGDLLDVAWDLVGHQSSSPSAGWFALLYGNLTSVTGQMESALSWYRIASEHFRVTGQMSRLRWTYAGTARAAATAGRVDEALDALDHLDALTAAPGLNAVLETDARAWIRSAQGDPAAARDLLDAAIDPAIEVGNRTAAVVALHSLARLGAPERAAARMAALRPELEGPLLIARADHVVALVDGTGPALSEVADRFEAVGALLFAAEAAADAARAHRQAQQARDATAAAQRARRLVARCEAVVTPALVLVPEAAPLTRREREVALLAAQGHPSKAIAERLFLSTRTVDNHLLRAYEKLGINSRDELKDLATALVGGDQ